MILQHSREEAERTEVLLRALMPEIEVSKSRATLLGAPLAEEELSDAVRWKARGIGEIGVASGVD